MQSTNLNEILRAILADCQPAVAGRKIEWKIAALPEAKCDQGLIKQVFANLISNAVKYTRARDVAVIEVSHAVIAEESVIFVRDNGAGFDMKHAERLFGAFQRLHRQDDFEGTGVGLATVRRIVQRHGGRIWAEAEVGKGATFYFTLSAEKSSVAEANVMPS
jgi:light-regulated signal transduction histidine kinase (bacteriophytochrome)